MLPNDVNMLVSFINTKLRDDDMSFEHLMEIYDADINNVKIKLESNGFVFDEVTNQIRMK